MNRHLHQSLVLLDPERHASQQLDEHDELLLATIMDQAQPQSSRSRRPHARRIAVVGLAAASLVGLGLTRIDLGGRPVGSSPAAAAVLERAADAALAEPPLTVKPGQYLLLTRIEEHWVASYGQNKDGPESVRIGSDGLPIAYQTRQTWQRWIPYDTSADWIVRESEKPLRNVSRESALFNEERGPEVYRQQSWSNRDGTSTYIATYDPAWYASLPRDPDKLLAQLKKDIGAGDDTSPEHLFMEVYSEVLRNGLAPPDIRSALFTALSRQPGMELVDGVANLDGRRGVALRFRGSNWQMLFDRETGKFIGERATNPDFPDVPGIDAARTTYLTTARAEVVDSAPDAD